MDSQGGKGMDEIIARLDKLTEAVERLTDAVREGNRGHYEEWLDEDGDECTAWVSDGVSVPTLSMEPEGPKELTTEISGENLEIEGLPTAPSYRATWIRRLIYFRSGESADGPQDGHAELTWPVLAASEVDSIWYAMQEGRELRCRNVTPHGILTFSGNLISVAHIGMGVQAGLDLTTPITVTTP